MSGGVDRIADLEVAVAKLIGQVGELSERLAALEAAPPKRDPASTVAADTAFAPTTDMRVRPVRAFGFGPPPATMALRGAGSHAAGLTGTCAPRGAGGNPEASEGRTEP